MYSKSSSRQILKSSSIIGGAAVVNVMIGLGKMKLAALLLGPAGVGLIALYQSLVTTAAQVGGLGIANASVRQVAKADADCDAAALAAARRALFAATAALAAFNALFVWLLGESIAREIIGVAVQTSDLPWLAIAIGLTIIASSQQHLLSGHRRIGELGRLGVASAAIGALLGVIALLVWRDNGIAAYVLAIPVGAVVAGAWYASQLNPLNRSLSPPMLLRAQARLMLAFGITMMLGNLAAPLAQLIVRGLVGTGLGVVPLGEYAAASTIALTYIGFIMAAMGVDYYPRLAAAIHDKPTAIDIVNQQGEIGLLLAAPLLMAMQSGAFWVVQVLYSSEFAGASDLLRLFVLADVLKVLGWPLGFVLLASGRGRTFFVTETLYAAIFIGITLVALPRFGLLATGAGVLAMYLVYLPLMTWLAHCSIGFRWQRRVWWMALGVSAAVATVGLASLISDRLALIIGAPLTISLGLYSLHRLSHLAQVDAPAARLAQKFAGVFRPRL